jgi:hypothetical protein
VSPAYRRFAEGTLAVSGCYFCWHFAARGEILVALGFGVVAAIYLIGLLAP